MEVQTRVIRQTEYDVLNNLRAESYRSIPNWHITEGVPGESRLYLNCGGHSLILSSRAFDNGDIRYDPSSRTIFVDTTFLGSEVRGLQDSARYSFELRVGQHMSDFDRMILEGIMALSTGNQNYMVSRYVDPNSILIQNPGRVRIADIGKRQEPVVMERQDAQVLYQAPERKPNIRRKEQREPVKNPVDVFLDTLIAKVKDLLGKIGDGARKPKVSSRPVQGRQAAIKEVPSITRAPELIIRQGRSMEDWADSIPLSELTGNPWGIEVLAGVADGFSKGNGQAFEMAQATIRTFWEQLETFVPYAQYNQDLSSLLPEVARRTNVVLSQRYDAADKGVCADIAIKTKSKLHILHIGEGRGYWRKGRDVSEWHIPVHTVPSFSLPDGRVGYQRLGGKLKVNRAFGATNYIPYGLSNTAEHYEFDLDKLRRTGISELLLTSDGIDELLRYASEHKIMEAAVYFGLSHPEFRRRLALAARSVSGIDDIAACRIFLN